MDEAKEELQEIVDILKQPEKCARLGARPPSGVMLVGAPGTGKTLLARAVAGEAGVPFISISASEFVELYVGMGARAFAVFARKGAVAIHRLHRRDRRCRKESRRRKDAWHGQ